MALERGDPQLVPLRKPSLLSGGVPHNVGYKERFQFCYVGIRTSFFHSPSHTLRDANEQGENEGRIESGSFSNLSADL